MHEVIEHSADGEVVRIDGDVDTASCLREPSSDYDEWEKDNPSTGERQGDSLHSIMKQSVGSSRGVQESGKESRDDKEDWHAEGVNEHHQ
jgi:hypothetical protein